MHLISKILCYMSPKFARLRPGYKKSSILFLQETKSIDNNPSLKVAKNLKFGKNQWKFAWKIKCCLTWLKISRAFGANVLNFVLRYIYIYLIHDLLLTKRKRKHEPEPEPDPNAGGSIINVVFVFFRLYFLVTSSNRLPSFFLNCP